MATAKIILFKKYKTDKDGWVKVQVIEDGKPRRYPCSHKKDTADPNAVSSTLKLGKKFTDNDFERIVNTPKGIRLSNEEHQYKKAFASFLKKADDCIREIDLFTFEAFEALYIKNRGAKDTIKEAFKERIAVLRGNGNISTAVLSECTITSLEKFKTGLKFVDITPKLLSDYEAWMRKPKHIKNKKTEKILTKPGASTTTVSMYLRTLRTVFNDAISDGVISEELYPFNRSKGSKSKSGGSSKKYSPCSGRKKKRAMNSNDLSALFYYKSDDKSKQQAADFWRFSYMFNGANFKDILLLKWKYIDVDFIRFNRAKTANTSDEPETVSASLEPEMRAVMSKYGIKSTNPEAYIFPFLNVNMDAETQYKKIQGFINFTNKKLKLICGELGIKNVSTYWARHSFATTLKKNNANLELIRESLGHKNIKTTMDYLGSFDDDVKKELAKSIIPKAKHSGGL